MSEPAVTIPASEYARLVVAAEARIAELEAALLTYGWHKADCIRYELVGDPGLSTDCTCGFHSTFGKSWKIEIQGPCP